jgi:hypothetical protein
MAHHVVCKHERPKKSSEEPKSSNEKPKQSSENPMLSNLISSSPKPISPKMPSLSDFRNKVKEKIAAGNIYKCKTCQKEYLNDAAVADHLCNEIDRPRKRLIYTLLS